MKNILILEKNIVNERFILNSCVKEKNEPFDNFLSKTKNLRGLVKYKNQTKSAIGIESLRNCK